MLSMSRLRGFFIGLLIFYPVWRIIRLRQGRISWWGELRALVASVVLLCLFVLAGALWHRPMLALQGSAPGEIVVDFHSHTNASHDVKDTWMRGFDAEANRRWHRRAGFDAFFITDHNNVNGLDTRHRPEAPAICAGIEVSAWHSHIVLLGDSLPVDRGRFDGSLAELLGLFRASRAEFHAFSVASLPEYRRNLWDRLDTLLAAGLDGFEIVNASPKANELTRAERDRVVRLAQQRDRFVVGVSDSHGWGATSMVWNLVRVPQSPGDLCSGILQRLGDGFEAVRIVERHRLRPDDWWPLPLTPVGVVWETWRSMGTALTWSWLLWIWIAAAARAGIRGGGIPRFARNDSLANRSRTVQDRP
jgi:hypothetical protein